MSPSGDDVPTNQKCELYAILRALEVHNKLRPARPHGLEVRDRVPDRVVRKVGAQWLEELKEAGRRERRLIRRILGLMRAKEFPVALSTFERTPGEEMRIRLETMADAPARRARAHYKLRPRSNLG